MGAGGAGLAEDINEAGPGVRTEELGGDQALSLGPSSPYSDSLPDLCMHRKRKPSKKRCLLST